MSSNDEPKVMYECPYCGSSYESQARCVVCIKDCKARKEGREFTFCTEVTINVYYSYDDDMYYYELSHEQHPGYVYKDSPDKFKSTVTGTTFALNAVSRFSNGRDFVRGLRYCYVDGKRIHSDDEIEKMLVETAKKEFKRISEEI